MDKTLMRRAVAEIGEWLRVQDMWLAGAESCTGGLIASTLTDVPGSSEWFKGCVVAYHNDVKTKLLGVDKTLLATDGAVSEACVRAMAKGAAYALGTDIGYAVSGIAGPGGGSAEKPVGTVWMAWYTAERTLARMHSFQGDRDQIKAQTVMAVINGLIGVAR